MDKNAIKKYAVWARRELIERVSQRAMIYGITAKDAGDPNADSVNGQLLSQAEKRQRQALIRNIKAKGYDQVVEEVAYTWFNRFAALRFMEVNGYLPSHIRVFTNDAGEFKPQILAEAIHLELDGLDMNKVYELESANKSEELFKYLLIVQCNALNNILPGMFQRIEDYTELLLPDYLLREGSVIEQMVTTIPEEDWTDQVQIIGWLYQYYNTEPKDKVFADLKKNIKITKENIPAATQLFTPDWIVHYMVENSLGRLWLEGHPNDALKSEWKYYLDEAEQEPEVQVQLATIRREYAALKPEEIRVIDPCMGSGHILCVLFDVLVRIYEDYGYTAREAAVKIVENNLWGLDIDERAAQLSYFAVMMKARQYDRRFFSKKVQPHVYGIHETNEVRDYYKQSTSDSVLSKENQDTLNYLMDAFIDAKEYGSILHLDEQDYIGLKDAWNRSWSKPGENVNFNLWTAAINPEISYLMEQAIALSQKYHVVVTNPPYMGSSGMSTKLLEYVKSNYPDGKGDLFAVFMEVCNGLTSIDGFTSMITQHQWMFLAGYEKLRKRFNEMEMVSLAHLGIGTFEDLNSKVVQSVAFILRKSKSLNYIGSYNRLFEKQGLQENNEDKMNWLLTGRHRFDIRQSLFNSIDGTPIAYWASSEVISNFSSKRVRDYSNARQGLITGDNDTYMRFWYEPEFSNVSFTCRDCSETEQNGIRWYPYSKGGGFRRWYGFNEYVVDWERNGLSLKNFKDDKGKLRSRPQNIDTYFKEGLTWSALTTYKLSLRTMSYSIYGGGGAAMFVSPGMKWYILGFMNSCVAQYYLNMINPTINFLINDILSLPVVVDSKNIIEDLVLDCIRISKEDYDAFEVSHDFTGNALVEIALSERKDSSATTINNAFETYKKIAERRITQLKSNEEEINRIFIEIYKMHDDISPILEDKEIVLHRPNIKDEVISFISYAVGCMFGRYSLDVPGLVYAAGSWDVSKYITFQPDKDAIIPICDDEYFEDDVVGRLVKFVEVVFGKETLEENLRFIANALGGKGSSREVIRSYFINEFYANHLKLYQKRPIYWLFDSGKKNGFKCLIYMHRYQPDTIARIRTDYVHEQQSRYRTAIADLEQRINGASTSERVKLSKQLATLQAQAEEIRVYEEKIHHLADQMIKIDLDDGVKHNYEIFKDVLAKIK